MAFTFPAMVAWDPNGKQNVKNVSFQVYAVTDTTFSTPLALTDTFNNPLPGNILNSGTAGVFPQFMQATNSTVVITDATHVYAWTVNCVQQDTAIASFINTVGTATQAALSATYAQVPTGTAPTLLGLTPGYDPAIAGANKLRWFTASEQIARTLGWLIVTDPKYGASPALADNSAAVNAAIADFKAQQNLGTNGISVYVPGAIFFPAGVYKFTSALTTIDFKFLTMAGAGIEASVLQWDGAGPLISLGTYTSAGGYGGAGSNFTIKQMQILSPAQIFLTSEGFRTGTAIQDNGSGGVVLESVKLRGFKYGFNGAYGSDFNSFIKPHLANCDVGIYLGPGSQQIKIDTPTVEYCREGLVIEGAAQGSLNDGWFTLNSVSDVTIEGNTTSRSGVAGTLGTYDLSWNMKDCWHETNAGGLGRIAPRIILVQGAPPNIIKHFRIERPYLTAGGPNTGSNAFLETNVTGANGVTELTIQDLGINGGALSYIVKNTAGLNRMWVRRYSIADGYTAPSIFSNSQSGYRYEDGSGYIQSALGGSFLEIRDGNTSNSRVRLVQQQDSSTSIQFWSGSAYIERLKLDTQNSRIYYNDTYLARLASGVLGVAPGSVIRTGLDVTANRPSASAAGAGSMFYDTTLSKPIWSDGTNWGTFDRTGVGLSNVDNTSDVSKPVSTAQQAALDLKAPLASPAFTGTPTGITKAHVGLGNVDNTSDVSKPVSVAQQAALDAKAPLVGANQLTAGEAVLERLIGAQQSTATISSGFMLCTYFTAQKTGPITQVRAATGATAYAATPTLCRYGIFTVAGDGSLTLVASTANDTTLFAAANTVYTKALTSTFNKVAGTRYAVGVLVVTSAATGSFMGYNALSNATSGFDLGPQLSAAVSGQADLPSSLSGAQPLTTRVPQFLLLP